MNVTSIGAYIGTTSIKAKGPINRIFSNTPLPRENETKPFHQVLTDLNIPNMPKAIQKLIVNYTETRAELQKTNKELRKINQALDMVRDQKAKNMLLAQQKAAEIELMWAAKDFNEVQTELNRKAEELNVSLLSQKMVLHFR